MRISDQKIKEYIAQDKITRLGTPKEAKAYYKNYCYLDFKSIKAMKEYNKGYYFIKGGIWYHCNFDGILEEIKKEG